MPEQQTRILIIDNDEGIVAAIAARLESIGYTCVTASTGAQGIAAFEENDIHLVITDLNMPAGDGIELARTLRKTSEVPIIIVTGFRDEYLDAVKVIPHVSMMEKPFHTDQLLDLVEAELVMAGARLPVS